jgi:hypothetical protein
LSHNVDEDVETEIEVEDESPIGTYDLDLELTSSVFSYFSMDRDTYHAYDKFLNHFEHAIIDECIYNYIFLADIEQDILNLVIQLSCDYYSEEETVTLDDEELLSKKQGAHIFSNKGECMHWHSSFLNQHVSDHGFENPVAVFLESYFSDSLKISDFIISLAFAGEYGFLKDFPLMLLYFCHYVLITGKDEIISVLKLF